MFGQMTAGSWIYIGSQGIVQGTYETFAEAGRQHYGGDLARQVDPHRGPGRHGRRAAARRDDGRRVDARDRMPAVAHRHAPCDALPRRQASDLDDALAIVRDACAARQPVSVGLLGNAAEILPELVRRNVRPRHGHRPDLGARPRPRLSAGGLDRRAMAGGAGRSRAASGARRRRRSDRSSARRGDARVPATAASPTFDYGNNIRQVAFDEGVADAFAFPGFVPAYIRPLFCEGKGPFRWVALSGDPEDIYRDRSQGQGAVPRQCPPASLARHGARAHRVPGTAGAHLLARAGRAAPRRARVQRDGEVAASSRRRS